jgi:hypothetical protein
MNQKKRALEWLSQIHRVIRGEIAAEDAIKEMKPHLLGVAIQNTKNQPRSGELPEVEE